MTAQKIQLHNKYQRLFTDNSRYFVVTGGRGSGKSFGVSLFLLNLVCEPGHKVLFTRYTMVSAHTSIIPEFVEKIELMGMNDQFRITRDEIINLETKSSIIFKGIRTSSGNQSAALKSLSGVTTFVVDEAEELINESDFDKVDFSVRVQDKPNRCILILNPTVKTHWIYKRFFQNSGVPEMYNGQEANVTYIHTDYRDNKNNLSPSFLEQIYEMKVKRPDKYMHQILGGWLAAAEGTIIKNWKVGEYVQTDLTCFGQDFGFKKDKSTLVQVSVNKDTKQMWVKEWFGETGMTTSEIAQKNKIYADSSLVIADSSEPRLIAELKREGCNIQGAKKRAGSVLSGIALLQDYEIIVDKTSTGIIQELNNYVWKDKGVAPKDEFSHYIDAMRYALEFLVTGFRIGKYVIR